MGLNKVYTTVRWSVLMINPLLPWHRTFPYWFKRRDNAKLPHNQLFIDSTSLHVNAGGLKISILRQTTYLIITLWIGIDQSFFFLITVNVQDMWWPNVMSNMVTPRMEVIKTSLLMFFRTLYQISIVMVTTTKVTKMLKTSPITRTIALDLITNTIDLIRERERWLMYIVLLLMTSLLEVKYYHPEITQLIFLDS